MSVREATKERTIGKLREIAGSDKFKTLKPETQEKVLNTLKAFDVDSGTTFRESKQPTLGGIQVAPKSPVGPLGRFKLGLASPKGREKILRKQFGEVFGPTGREFVLTDKGFQAVDPKGLDRGDVFKGLAHARSTTGQISGSIVGGIAGGIVGKPVRGSGIGAFIGTTAGEIEERMLGKALGLRPENTVIQEIKGALKEAAIAAGLEITFAGAARAFPGIGKAFTKVGTGTEEILRKVGNVKKMTASWFKERVSTVGAKEVFKPIKLSAEYASIELLPRIKAGVIGMFKNFTDDAAKFAKGAFNLSDDAVKILRTSGYDDVVSVQQRLGNSTADISNKLQTTLTKNLDDAGKIFDDVISSQPRNTRISRDNFIKSMQKTFRDEGYMTNRNNFRTDVDFKNAPSQIKKLRNIYDEVASKKDIFLNDYFRYRGLLDDAVNGKTMDRTIFQAQGGLRQDAVESIQFLDEANKVYSKAKKMADDFLPEKYTGEKALEKFPKMTAKEKAKLAALDKEIPFLDDVRKLHVARELDNIDTKVFDPKKIESLFGQGANEAKTVTRDFLKGLDEVFPQNYKFYNDLRDWYAHMDLQEVGAYTSGAGIRRSFAEIGTGQYYKNLYPFLKRGGDIGQKVFGPAARTGQKIIKGVTEPTFKGVTLRPGATALRQFLKER